MTRVLKKMFQSLPQCLLICLFLYKLTLPAMAQEPKKVSITMLNRADNPIRGVMTRINGDTVIYRSNIISLAIPEGQQQVEVEFSHPDFETERMTFVPSGEKRMDTVRMKGKLADGRYFGKGVVYGYVTKKSLIGVKLSAEGKKDFMSFQNMVSQLGLEIIDSFCISKAEKGGAIFINGIGIDISFTTSEPFFDPYYYGIVLQKKNGENFQDFDNAELKALRSSELIFGAGPIMSVIGAPLKLFSNGISVGFIDENVLQEILKKYGATATYVRPDKTGYCTLIFDGSIGYGIHQIATELKDHYSVLSPYVVIINEELGTR